MAISFEDYVKNGNCNITTTATTSKLTEHLRSWVTVPKYYQGQLDEIAKGSKRALKSIKKLPSGEYQLKIQLGKFAHGLIIQDGEEYRSATFPTKEEAIQAYQDWIEGLKDGNEGIISVVRPAWQDYCEAMQINVAA
jgi:hypothetical protein